VGGDLVQVTSLVGAAAAHRAALDLDRNLLRFVGTLGDLLDIGLRQAQVDGVVVEGRFAGFGVQRFNQLLRLDDGFVGAADAEHEATICDLHAELQLDLAQVPVEGAAQVGQSLVVFRRQGEVSMIDAFHCLGWGGRLPPQCIQGGQG